MKLSGGYGQVSKRQIDGQDVAVKTQLDYKICDYNDYGEPIYHDDFYLAELFRDEVRGAEIIHALGEQPYLMTISEVSEYAIHMEWIDGESLDDYITKTKKAGEVPSFDERKALLAKILYGLRSLHMAGISHNDLKPDNIMIRNGSLEPVIIDFSLVEFNEPCRFDHQNLFGDAIAADLLASFGKGFSFIAGIILAWEPWSNVSSITNGQGSCVNVPRNIERGPNSPSREERDLWEALTIISKSTRFEEIEDLLI